MGTGLCGCARAFTVDLLARWLADIGSLHRFLCGYVPEFMPLDLGTMTNQHGQSITNPKRKHANTSRHNSPHHHQSPSGAGVGASGTASPPLSTCGLCALGQMWPTRRRSSPPRGVRRERRISVDSPAAAPPHRALLCFLNRRLHIEILHREGASATPLPRVAAWCDPLRPPRTCPLGLQAGHQLFALPRHGRGRAVVLPQGDQVSERREAAEPAITRKRASLCEQRAHASVMPAGQHRNKPLSVPPYGMASNGWRTRADRTRSREYDVLLTFSSRCVEYGVAQHKRKKESAN